MAVVHSAVLVGVDIVPVRIEALVSSGFSGVHILGLPSEWARDARERVRTALEAAGLRTEERKILLQVTCTRALKLARSAPALLDFGLAAAALIAHHESAGILALQGESADLHLLGELRLSGELEPGACTAFPCAVRHELAENALLCAAAESGLRGARVREFGTLKDFARWLLEGGARLGRTESLVRSNGEREAPEHEAPETPFGAADRAHFRAAFLAALPAWSQEPALGVALVLALAGRHNLLVVGSPGIGKTHCIRLLERLLPPLTEHESACRRLLCSGIASEVGAHPRARPFRAPQHTCSTAGLVGNAQLQPGEFSLSHRGVLFLDEFLEFARTRTEALREPLELGRVHLARAMGSVSLPADFQLLAAANPCACGYSFHPSTPCRCLEADRKRAMRPLSGPLLDRFHLRLALGGPNGNGSRAPPPIATDPSSRLARAHQHALAPFAEVLEAAARDPQLGEAFAQRVASALARTYYGADGGQHESPLPLSRSVDSLSLETIDALEPRSPLTESAWARDPATRGLFANQRARLQTNALLHTLEAVFPNVCSAVGMEGSLGVLGMLRNLEGTVLTGLHMAAS